MEDVNSKYATVLVFDRNWRLVAYSRMAPMRLLKTYTKLDPGIYKIFVLGVNGWYKESMLVF